jgi:hypothetical protein
VEATGNRFAYFTVHNRSSHLCQLGRFPTVRLFDAKGRALATHPHTRLFGTVQHPITSLAPDQTGSFALIFFPQDGSGDFCRPVAHTATIRFRSTVTRVSLPTHLAKEHEPINPCRGQLSITQVNSS